MRRSAFLVTTVFATLTLIASAQNAAAQQPGVPGGAQPASQQQRATDPLMRFLFPPELIMQHQSEISLTDAQRTAITTAMQQAQGKFVDMQFKLSGEGEKLGRLLQGSSVDESQVLEQVDRILALERELKRAQVGLLVRLKNVLTAQQQAKLGQLR
jgi:Spy/CpxP family protein refolding chaperone